MKDKFKEILGKYSQEKNLDLIGKNKKLKKKKVIIDSDICQVCGEKMKYSEKEEEKDYEQRWSIHYECYLNTQNRLDRETGILTERKR